MTRMLLIVALAAVALPGCAQWNAMIGAEPPTDVVAGITPPAERIAILRKLADKAGSAPAEQQESIAAQLAAVFRQEPDPLIRAELVRTLGAYRTETSASILRASLNDADAEVRVAACRAWAQRNDPEAAALLAKTLGSDVDSDVRLAAAESLGDVGRQGAATAVPALGVALEDRDPAMQYRAVTSLQKVTGEDFGNDVNRWRQYVSNELPESPKPVSVGERFRRMF